MMSGRLLAITWWLLGEYQFEMAYFGCLAQASVFMVIIFPTIAFPEKSVYNIVWRRRYNYSSVFLMWSFADAGSC
ncbi:MAG TPA: hypothetical protein VHL11_09270 [Phototrophicaceae bacterium]|jgi:hypothetical protein|nr:hypothetical protein [Phototrophicaceae bacterium]